MNTNNGYGTPVELADDKGRGTGFTGDGNEQQGTGLGYATLFPSDTKGMSEAARFAAIMRYAALEFAALFATGAIAYYAAPRPWVMGVCGIAAIVTAFASAFVAASRPKLAAPLAVLVAALIGPAVGAAVGAYAGAGKGGAVVLALLGTVVITVSMGWYGLTTKRDLGPMGRILLPLLIGVIVVGVVNIFVGAPLLSLLLAWASLGVFTLYIALDVQRAKYEEAAPAFVALSLLLDVVNVFLALLRIIGGGARD